MNQSKRESVRRADAGIGGAWIVVCVCISVALVAAGIWLAVDLSGGSESETPTAFAPALGPHSVGLVLTHRGESL